MDIVNIVVFLLLVLVLYYIFVNIISITVYEYERALRYYKGLYTGLLLPGCYWIWRKTTTVVKLDIRLKFISITGQEVLSSDGVTLKVSLAAKYEIVDPHKAVNTVDNYQEALYLVLQLALREIIGSTKIDDLLDKRHECGGKLMEITKQQLEDIGLKLHSVNLKDIMFPGDLKKIFAHVVKVQKEGVAALERARSETAALRHLANAAKMIENNPALLQLRILQAVNDSSGNTFVIGTPSSAMPFPVKGKGTLSTTEERTVDLSEDI